MCERESRELLELLGNGYEGDFIGTVDKITGSFRKDGFLYRNVCIKYVHRDGHKEDKQIQHLWVDILDNDLTYYNIKRGSVIVVHATIEKYTRKDGSQDMGLRTYTIKRVVKSRKGNINDKFKIDCRTSENCNRTSKSNKKRSRG